MVKPLIETSGVSVPPVSGITGPLSNLWCHRSIIVDGAGQPNAPIVPKVKGSMCKSECRTRCKYPKCSPLVTCFIIVCFWRMKQSGGWLLLPQVSLVVNVASECGFTEQHYKDLQQLQRDFGPYHFNVLAFPCNQFGQQEPGSDKEIDSFVRRVYSVSFPLFSKIAVVGTGANNIYKHLVGELTLVCLEHMTRVNANG